MRDARVQVEAERHGARGRCGHDPTGLGRLLQAHGHRGPRCHRCRPFTSELKLGGNRCRVARHHHGCLAEHAHIVLSGP